MKKVRTRFAPSPTGFQHIGGFRTAMFAWLFAKANNGDFVLRIENTDQARSVNGATKYIIESLEWLGIDISEGPSYEDLKSIDEYWEGAPELNGNYGPYIQSERLTKYQAMAEKLINEGFAYRCDCTPEMLEKERNEQMARREMPGYSGYCRTRNVSKDSSHIVRLKLPGQFSISFDDSVRGHISWENPPLRDPILLKSNGSATYHLASVVDDTEMEITHVFRGEEWIPTTPIHLFLYDSLGIERPIFSHLSHILGVDGKKLSKRHGAASLNVFREEGYLPEAILNYITRIGWSPGEGEEREIFSIDELVKIFSLKGLSKSSGVYDVAKLQWMNGVYLREISLARFNEFALPLLEKEFVNFDRSKWDLVAPVVKDRLKVFNEIPQMVEFLFVENLKRDIDQITSKKIDSEGVRKVLEKAIEKIKNLNDFSIKSLELAIKEIPDELDLKMGPVFIAVRIAVTGKKATPPLFDSMFALGKDKCLKRLEETIKLL